VGVVGGLGESVSTGASSLGGASNLIVIIRIGLGRESDVAQTQSFVAFCTSVVV